MRVCVCVCVTSLRSDVLLPCYALQSIYRVPSPTRFALNSESERGSGWAGESSSSVASLFQVFFRLIVDLLPSSYPLFLVHTTRKMCVFVCRISPCGCYRCFDCVVPHPLFFVCVTVIVACKCVCVFRKGRRTRQRAMRSLRRTSMRLLTIHRHTYIHVYTCSWRYWEWRR
jgi:hypothetical protein